MSHRFLVAPALAVAAVTLGFATGCAEPAVVFTEGDDAPEGFVGQSRLRDIFAVEDGWLVSPVLPTPDLATRVAVWLATADDAASDAVRLEVRGYDEAGVPGAWSSMQERWREGNQRVGRVELGALATAVELRLALADADAVDGLVYSAVLPDPDEATRVRADISGVGVDVDLGGGGGGLEVDAPATSTQALDIAGVEPRSAWGARADAGCSNDPNKSRISVHHSVTPLRAGGTREQFAAELRGIQSFHMDGRGYCDTGYHFATTSDGTVWETREARFLGAHTGGNNSNNAGIVFLGCFHPVADCNGLGGTTPPAAMLQGGGAAIGRIATRYGIAINGANVIGHRDNPGQTTSCPGDGLHALLPQLRTIASEGGVVATTGTVRGTVWDLSVTADVAQSEALGARLPGATVTLDDGTSAIVGADGLWSLTAEAGVHTLTATQPGFAPATREVQVVAGSEVWASIGVAPLEVAVDVRVRVVDAETEAPLLGATVTPAGGSAVAVDGEGTAALTLAAGDIELVVAAEGYTSRTVREQLVAGAAVSLDVQLQPKVVVGEGEGEGEETERVTILPPPTAQGCTSANAGTAGVGAGLALALLALGRRRARGRRARAD